MTCRKRSATAGGSDAAPQKPARTPEMSASAIGTSSTAPSEVGTAPTRVAPYCPARRQNPCTIAGVRRPPGEVMRRLTPAMKALRPQKIVPPTWNRGSVAVSVSVGRMSASTAPPNAAASWLRCVCATRRGVPVVPPVWK